MTRLRAMSRVVLLSVASVAMLTGCSREHIDWKSAEAADTQEAYGHFLQRHPESPLATQARARLAQLAEDKDWRRASAADTSEAYKQFLAQHASGKWAEEARIRIENFTLDSNPSPTAILAADRARATDAPGAAAPGTLAEPGTPASAPTPALLEAGALAQPGTPAEPPAAGMPGSSPPGAEPARAPAHQASSPASASQPTVSKAAPAPQVSAATAPAMASAATAAAQPASSPPPAASAPITHASGNSAGYGIQLGAFSTQAAALGEWTRLQTAFGPELHGLLARTVPAHVGSNTMYRLQSPVGEEARARGICAALAKRSQPCVVVLPEKR